MYEVRITPEGLRHLDKLPDKIRTAAVEAIFSTLAANPRRAGKALLGDLEGLYSARRGDYRVIYEIDETAHALVVHRIQHRRDVYRAERRPYYVAWTPTCGLVVNMSVHHQMLTPRSKGRGGVAARLLVASALLVLMGCQFVGDGRTLEEDDSSESTTVSVTRACRDKIAADGIVVDGATTVGDVVFENLRAAAVANGNVWDPDDEGRYVVVKTPTIVPAGRDLLVEIVNREAGGLVYGHFRPDGRYSEEETSPSVRLVGCPTESATFNGGFVSFGAGCLHVRIRSTGPELTTHDALIPFGTGDCEGEKAEALGVFVWKWRAGVVRGAVEGPS